jgi:hypothetical protein
MSQLCQALSKLAGYEEEVKKSSTEKAKDFCNKAPVTVSLQRRHLVGPPHCTT